jgi:DNA-binding FrmR family transcriptional regulator
MTQINAVGSALDSVARIIVKDYVEICIAAVMGSEKSDASIATLKKALLELAC